MRQVVESDVENDAGRHSDLATLAESDLSGLEDVAVVLGVRGTSSASVALFDAAISGTSISIGVVAIVTLVYELESVSTSFHTPAQEGVKVEFNSTLDTCIAVSTTQTASRTSNTLAMVVIEVTTDGTG